MFQTRQRCLITAGSCVVLWIVLGALVAVTPPSGIDVVAGVVDLGLIVLLIVALVRYFRLPRNNAS